MYPQPVVRHPRRRGRSDQHLTTLLARTLERQLSSSGQLPSLAAQQCLLLPLVLLPLVVSLPGKPLGLLVLRFAPEKSW